MDSGQEESDFGIKIDAVFSLASTEAEAEAEECSQNDSADSVPKDDEIKRSHFGSDVKSCEVRLIDIFDEKIVQEYWSVYRGHQNSKQLPTPVVSNAEECKNFDVIFAKDAVYERGKRKRKSNVLVKGPDYVEVPPTNWLKKRKFLIGPEKTKYKNVKISPVVVKQKKRILFEKKREIFSRRVLVEKLVETANHFLSLPGKSKPAVVYRPQVARTKKKLRKRQREIGPVRTSSPSPPRLEPVSARIETVRDEKPPKLEPEFSDLNMDFDDASLSLSFSGRFRKKSKKIGKDFVTKKKRKVAKVTPLQSKQPEALTNVSDLQSLQEASLYGPRMQSLLKTSPKDKKHGEVLPLATETNIASTRSVKTPEFTAAINKLAKKENTKKFFQLKIGDKIILIPTDGSSVMPKAFVLDNPAKCSDPTPVFQTAKAIPKQGTYTIGPNSTHDDMKDEDNKFGENFPLTQNASQLHQPETSSDSSALLQSIKQEPPDHAYIAPDPQDIKSNNEYITPDHDYMTSDQKYVKPYRTYVPPGHDDVKPDCDDVTSLQKDIKADDKRTTASASKRYVEASRSPINPDIVLLRMKNNDQPKIAPKLPQATVNNSKSILQPRSEIVVLPNEQQALKIQTHPTNTFNRSILSKAFLPSQSGRPTKTVIIPKLGQDGCNLTRSSEIVQQAIRNSQNYGLHTSLPSKTGTVPSIKIITPTSDKKATVSTTKIPIQKLPKQGALRTALKQKLEKPEVTQTTVSNVSTIVSTSPPTAPAMTGHTTASLAKLPNGNLVYILTQDMPDSQSPNYQFMLAQSTASSIVSFTPSAIPSSMGFTLSTPSLSTQTLTSPLFTLSSSPSMTSSSSSSSLLTSNVQSSNTTLSSNSGQVKVIHPPSKAISQNSTQGQHKIQISKDKITSSFSKSGPQSASSALKYLSNVHRSQMTDQLLVKMPFEKSPDASEKVSSNTENEQSGGMSSVDMSIVKQEPVDDTDTELRMSEETEQEEENLKTEPEEETVEVKEEIDEVSEEVDVVGENTGNDDASVSESETESEHETSSTSHLQFEHLTLDNGNTATLVTEHVPIAQGNVEAEDKIRKLREMLRVQKEKIEKLRKSNLLSS